MKISAKLSLLVGSGHKIGLFVLPFLAAGVALNVLRPAWFAVGGRSAPLLVLAGVLLIPGVIIWAWSVYLVLTRVPRGELITSGPFALVKHPLYTGASLLVLPAVGLLCNSWLWIALGGVFYLGCRLFAPREEKALAETFGPAWEAYTKQVWLPWL